jgi:hypothetical protein
MPLNHVSKGNIPIIFERVNQFSKNIIAWPASLASWPFWCDSPTNYLSLIVISVWTAVARHRFPWPGLTGLNQWPVKPGRKQSCVKPQHSKTSSPQCRELTSVRG